LGTFGVTFESVHYILTKTIRMSDLKVVGGSVISGTVTPSGNKNSVLPVMCATILTEEPVTLRNVPEISDVAKLVDFMTNIGSNIEWDKKSGVMTIINDSLDEKAAQEGFPLGMFGAVLLLGPLSARFGKVVIKSQVKGCSLGMRPLDPHFIMMEKFGAKITRNCNTEISFDNPKGSFIWTDHQSVTTTENAIMMAVLAKGVTEFVNAACEPHVQDLCNFLNSLGAKIEGIGSNRLVINGVGKLGGGEFDISSDHHEITTFLALGAMTGGEVRVKKAIPQHFPLIIDTFKKLGVEIEYDGDTAIVRKDQSFEVQKTYENNLMQRIEIAPWPYFPVDLLPLMIALSLKSKGEVWFWNKMYYEWGLFWLPELVKLGAKIMMCDQYRVLMLGPCELKGTIIKCPDIIRATVALVMAAMAAKGESTLQGVDTIFRAHPGFFEQLTKLGGDLEVIDRV